MMYSTMYSTKVKIMKYFLIKSKKKSPYPLVLRGKDSAGKPYKFFVKIDAETIRIADEDWNQAEQKVRKNKSLSEYLRDLKTTLSAKVLQNKLASPDYSIPDAWNELFGKPNGVEKLSDKVVDVIEPYMRDNRGNKSAGYLRHFTQLKTDLSIWNKNIKFKDLNEDNLTSYLNYLKGIGTPKRATLKSSTIGHHFKHLRQVARYAGQRGIKVEPKLYDFSSGKVIYTTGCFDLTFEELMVLWNYKPQSKTEEIVLDHSLFEAFTGIRTGDLYSFREDGSEHGIKCGDVNEDYIAYRDRKNHDMIKTVTRHRFNERFITKYMKQDPNTFLLPPMTQQESNRIIKTIAKNCNLNRGVRRATEIVPLHQAISSHCFRASYGNLLYRLGITSEVVSEELGHAAANVTIKHYLKFSDRHSLINEKMDSLYWQTIKRENERQ